MALLLFYCCCLTFLLLPKVLEATASEITAGFYIYTKSKVCTILLFQCVQVGLRVCISDKFLGGSSVGAVGQETTLCQLLLYVI